MFSQRQHSIDYSGQDLPIGLVSLPRLEEFERCDASKNYDFEEIRKRALKGPRVTTLLEAFEKIASGRIQSPRINVEAAKEFLDQNPDLKEYHKTFQRNLGTFLKHGCASIPFLIEEVVRMGLAINKLAILKHSQTNLPFNYWETSSADGSVARTLAEFSKGKINTLTDSPNEANRLEFERLCTHSNSVFHKGSFVDITPELLASKYPHLSGKFDVIWENTTFQMYGNYRDEQIAYTRRVLKEDGIMIFFEKMSHPYQPEYLRRELMKDQIFKTRYFSAEDISNKKADIVNIMELGQTTLGEFSQTIREHFEYAYLIWNSANFYQIAASNDEATLHTLLSNLEKPYLPEGFGVEPLGIL